MSKIKLSKSQPSIARTATFILEDGGTKFLGFYFTKRSSSGKYAFKAKRQSTFKIKRQDRYRIFDIYLGNVILANSASFKSVVTQYLANLNKSCLPYKVICNESNNQQESIAKGILNVDFYVPRPQENIRLDFILEKKKENDADSTI